MLDKGILSVIYSSQRNRLKLGRLYSVGEINLVGEINPAEEICSIKENSTEDMSHAGEENFAWFLIVF